MNILKKLQSIIIVIILLLHTIQFNAYASPALPTQKPIKAAVFLNYFNSLLISDAKKA